MGGRPTVLAIGSFDGVHLGHQLLFTEARRIAADRDAEVLAVTFDPHPIAVLRPDHAPPMLMHLEQRQAALLDAGADRVVWLETDAELLSLEADAFIKRLVDQHQAIAIVEGSNFHFGHNRAGSPTTLIELGERFGFDTHIADILPVTLRDKTLAPVSSTFTRWLVWHGRMSDAALCLGRPWQVRGKVVEGDQRGRTIGVPTANLDTGIQMMPADGVYAGTADVDGRAYPVALSVGAKPTFDGAARTVEAHLIGYEGDLYGSTLAVDVLRWLREQRSFAGVDQLKQQIAHDLDTLARLDGAGLLDPLAVTRA